MSLASKENKCECESWRVSRVMSRRSLTIITLPPNIRTRILDAVCQPDHHSTKIHKGRGGNKSETTERKLLATTVQTRFNDPSYQRSALSTSKQHWPTDKCLLWDHCFTITMFLAVLARFDVWAWNQNLITMPHSSARIEEYHSTGGCGQGLLWRFHCWQNQWFSTFYGLLTPWERNFSSHWIGG